MLPSPYQRDLFAALAARPEIKLSVFYLEDAAPDSPWPDRPLAEYETILPGRWVGVSPRRVHVNWDLPDFNRFDVVVLNTSYLALATQWLMRIGLRKPPWVFWAERLREQKGTLKRVGQRLLTRPLRRASGIVAIGSLAERDYARLFPEQRIFNIPYYCDLSAFREASRDRASNEEVVFLCCGQMIHRKGVDLLLQAFESLVEGGIEARLVLVGREADLPSIMQEIGAEARARIVFEGFQAPENLPGYFARADVFVLPSRHDGWGVVVNQALGAGLPIICSDAVGAAHDLIEPGVNGEMVPAGEVEPLRKTMLQLASDDQMREAWSDAAQRVACEWTPDRGAGKWIQVIRAITNDTA